MEAATKEVQVTFIYKAKIDGSVLAGFRPPGFIAKACGFLNPYSFVYGLLDRTVARPTREATSPEGPQALASILSRLAENRLLLGLITCFAEHCGGDEKHADMEMFPVPDEPSARVGALTLKVLEYMEKAKSDCARVWSPHAGAVVTLV